MKEVRKESDLVCNAIEFLLTCSIPAWRNNSGRLFGGSAGRKYTIQIGFKGAGDILGVLPPNGRAISLEAKMGKRKPTEDQQNFMDAVNKAGGLAFTFHSVEELEEILEKEGVL